jgi:5-methylcytosine-specific restriction protein A
MVRKKRVAIPSEVRKYVLERDNYQCRSCGKTAAEAKLHIDHIIPLARGGMDDISNLQTLCQRCNQRKRHNTDTRFQRQFQL